jgi:lipopolysaccharide/colanic/teichoic acid biosynthesis glycosyltransferase
MWKFRTMGVDAEAETGPVWASRGDPRRTRLGRILRRLSLDELPQLWNVLCGHMSVVGPRPERPTFVASFSEGDPWYRFRHRIRPGITGLAQVRGLRGDTPLAPRVESDNWYIEHWSVGLDLRIAARTVAEVFGGRNAQ